MLLAIDTSTAQVGLALGDAHQLAGEMIWHSHQHQTTELAPALAELLRHAGATMDQIDALAVAIGPGSFTALRVGLALAKGLAIARNLPIIGVPTLDVLAAGQPPVPSPLAAVLQAGRGRIVVGWYRPASGHSGDRLIRTNGAEGAWEPQGEPELTTVDALARSIDRRTLVAGELSPDERQRLARKKVNVVLAPPHMCVRRPSLLAEIGRLRQQVGHLDHAGTLAPIYLQAGEPIPA